MNGPRRAHHAVFTEKILSSTTFFIFVRIGNANFDRHRPTKPVHIFKMIGTLAHIQQ